MKMNRFFLSLLSTLLMTSCASEYSIEGTSSVSRLDGKMLFIKVPRHGKMVKVDSAEVVHGSFKMNGIADTARIASLFMDDESILPLVIEKGKIKISIDYARSKVSGTPLNESLYKFIDKKSAIDDKAYELERKESRMIMDGKEATEVEMVVKREREKIMNEMTILSKGFIKDNYQNILGPGMFVMLCSNLEYALITPAIQAFLDESPDCFRQHPLVQDFIEIAKLNAEKLKVSH